MEFWAELWAAIRPITLTLISALVTFLVTEAVQWLSNKTAEAKERIKGELATRVVRYVEQVSNELLSEEKFALAVAKLTALFEEKKLNASEEEKAVLVEQAVNALPKNEKKPEGSQQAAEPAPEGTIKIPATPEDYIALICEEAKRWVGYEGHKSEAYLTEPKKNVGGKYNIFAKKLENYYPCYVQNQDWCCLGVISCFEEVLGEELAKKIVGAHYCVEYLYDDVKARGGKVVEVPQPGDIEIQGNFDHTALVVNVTGGMVQSVSFNSTTRLPYGEVSSPLHAVEHAGIRCYIRPNWSVLE